MPRWLCIRNRQRVRAVDVPRLRQLVRHLVNQYLAIQQCELCLHLVDDPEMSRINLQFLGHHGSTDVITFDHSDLLDCRVKPAARTARLPMEQPLYGEIFLCLRQAVVQAAAFRTTWQLELTRYLVHGLLHLRGHDDRQPKARRRMKQAENKLVRMLAAALPLSRLARRPPRPPRRAPARPRPHPHRA